MRVVIADDEAPARRLVAAHLAGRSAVQIVAEAANGLEAVEAIRDLEPDLVFLDIQMPGMSGLEVVEAVGAEAMPAVVFVTAYDEFAIEAFDLHAADYLLKPFSRERFDRAFDRASERIGDAGRRRGELARLLEASPQGARPLERIVVRKDDRLFFVAVKDVTHLTAEGNYVRVHSGEASHLIRGTLGLFESRLDPQRFARIHRSELVNIEAIKEVQAHFHGDYIVILRGGQRLRLSRRYQQRLLGGA